MNEEKMNEDPEVQARKAEIATTRARLAEEVEEIEDRVSPENVSAAAKEKAKDMAEHAKQVAKDKVRGAAAGAKDKAEDLAIQARDGARSMATDVRAGVRQGSFDLGTAIRDNPVPAALTALGIGYLVHQALTAEREYEYDYTDGHLDYASYGRALDGAPLGRQARMGAGSAIEGDDRGRMDRAKEGLRDAKESAREGAADLADRARDRSRRAARKARRGGRKARRRTSSAFDSQQMLFGLGAFAAGLAIGAMIPSTDREDALMGERSDRLLGEARDRAETAGRVAADAAREGAREAKAHLEDELPRGGSKGSAMSDGSNGSSRSTTI